MQLEMAWRDAETLRGELEGLTGHRVSLTITNNSSTVLSAKPWSRGLPLELRIHHMFLTAEPRVISALAKWLISSRRKNSVAGMAVDRFIAGSRHLIETKRPQAFALRTRGNHFDLEEIFDELNDRYFAGTVDVRITWGRFPTTRRRHSIRLGSFSEENNLIRIHPFLDQKFVPAHFVRYIVYHEMLHAHVGISVSRAGRRQIHGAEFKKHERNYPDYERAVAWQSNERNLKRLLTSRVVSR